MRFSNDELRALLTRDDVTFVGLIHRKTHEIVLARCIPELVYLELKEQPAGAMTDAICIGEAIEGKLIKKDNFECIRIFDEEELVKINDLLKQGLIPRIATYQWDDNLYSAHQLLFRQEGLENKQDWGGFAVRGNGKGGLVFTYTSGAFNSPIGKRIKGATIEEKYQAIISDKMTKMMKLINNDSVLDGSNPNLKESKENNDDEIERSKPRK